MVPLEQGRSAIRVRSRRRGQYALRILGVEVEWISDPAKNANGCDTKKLRLRISRFELALPQFRNPLFATMKTQLLVITGLSLLLVACNRQQPSAAAPKTDLDRFHGTWYLLMAMQDGNTLPDEKVKLTTIIYKGDTFVFPGLAEFVTSKSGTIKLDETKTPKEIDAISPEKEVRLGIYALDEGGYKVCFAPAGQPRPTAMGSAPGSGNLLQAFAREKRN